MDAIVEYFEAKQNNQSQIRRLLKYMDNHGIKRGGCVIHGEHGPVWWEKIGDHPKVRAKISANRG